MLVNVSFLDANRIGIDYFATTVCFLSHTKTDIAQRNSIGERHMNTCTSKYNVPNETSKKVSRNNNNNNKTVISFCTNRKTVNVKATGKSPPLRSMNCFATHLCFTLKIQHSKCQANNAAVEENLFPFRSAADVICSGEPVSVPSFRLDFLKSNRLFIVRIPNDSISVSLLVGRLLAVPCLLYEFVQVFLMKFFQRLV